MNPFQLLPRKFRVALYLAYSAAGLGVTSIAAGYGAIDHTVPTWVLWAGGALVPLAAPLGVTAVSNVTAPAPKLTVITKDPGAAAAIDKVKDGAMTVAEARKLDGQGS